MNERFWADKLTQCGLTNSHNSNNKFEEHGSGKVLFAGESPCHSYWLIARVELVVVNGLLVAQSLTLANSIIALL